MQRSILTRYDNLKIIYTAVLNKNGISQSESYWAPCSHLRACLSLAWIIRHCIVGHAVALDGPTREWNTLSITNKSNMSEVKLTLIVTHGNYSYPTGGSSGKERFNYVSNSKHKLTCASRESRAVPVRADTLPDPF